MTKKSISPLQADLALLAMTAIWGSTFPILKILVVSMSPDYLVGLRFLLATAILTPFAWINRRSFSAQTWSVGVGLGLLLWGGYITQTTGIQYTTASKAAFITALSVVLTPIFSTLLLQKRPSRAAVVGVTLAVCGLGLLTLDIAQPWTFQRGDLFVLVCALLYTFQIIAVDYYGAKMDPLLLTWVELIVVALMGLGTAVLRGPLPTLSEPRIWGGLAYLACLGTAITQYLQIKVQPYSNPTRVSLIFSLEPVFAALLAFVVLGERLPGLNQIGAGFMLAGVVVSELGGRRPL